MSVPVKLLPDYYGSNLLTTYVDSNTALQKPYKNFPFKAGNGMRRRYVPLLRPVLIFSRYLYDKLIYAAADLVFYHEDSD